MVRGKKNLRAAELFLFLVNTDLADYTDADVFLRNTHLANLTNVDEGCPSGGFVCASFVFSRGIPVASQLWGNCTTAVRQLHHNCEAVAP